MNRDRDYEGSRARVHGVSGWRAQVNDGRRFGNTCRSCRRTSRYAARRKLTDSSRLRESRRCARHARTGEPLPMRPGNLREGTHGRGRRLVPPAAGARAVKAPLRGIRRPGTRRPRAGAWASLRDGGRVEKGTRGYPQHAGRHAASVPAVQRFARSVRTQSTTLRRRDNRRHPQGRRWRVRAAPCRGARAGCKVWPVCRSRRGPQALFGRQQRS